MINGTGVTPGIVAQKQYRPSFRSKSGSLRVRVKRVEVRAHNPHSEGCGNAKPFLVQVGWP